MHNTFVSIVDNAPSTETRDVTVQEVLSGIKDGKWRAEVESIRAEYRRAVADGRDAKKAVASLKKNLPAVMWSGQFKTRAKSVPLEEKLVRHSGLLCADLDHLDGQIEEVRSKLNTSPYLLASFLSPTGSGVKALFLVPADAAQHKVSFESVRHHIHQLTALEIDGACSDVTRLCFVSDDPDLLCRDAVCSQICIPALLPTCESALLHNTASASLHSCITGEGEFKADSILGNIKAKVEARNALTANRPALVNLYDRLIEQRFQAMPHERNKFIVEAVPFLYRVVAAPFVLELVGCFYDSNRSLFNDPREQHMHEAESMLQTVMKNYPESLSANERDIYEALPERERDAFRICRDLAMLPEPKREPLTFFMSFTQLGDRLGIFPTQAQRIMRQFAGYGLLKLVQPGTRRSKAVPGKAGSYEWMLKP